MNGDISLIKGRSRLAQLASNLFHFKFLANRPILFANLMPGRVIALKLILPTPGLKSLTSIALTPSDKLSILAVNLVIHEARFSSKFSL